MVIFKDGEPYLVPDDYLAHHGVIGMKWGVRRYQNKDGTLTDKGKKRYNEAIRGGAYGVRTQDTDVLKFNGKDYEEAQRFGPAVIRGHYGGHTYSRVPAASGGRQVRSHSSGYSYQVDSEELAKRESNRVLQNRNDKEKYDTKSGKMVNEKDLKALSKYREKAYNAMVESRDEFAKLVSDTVAKSKGQHLSRSEKKEMNAQFRQAYADILNTKIGTITLPSGRTATLVNDVFKKDALTIRFKVD